MPLGAYNNWLTDAGNVQWAFIMAKSDSCNAGCHCHQCPATKQLSKRKTVSPPIWAIPAACASNNAAAPPPTPSAGHQWSVEGVRGRRGVRGFYFLHDRLLITMLRANLCLLVFSYQPTKQPSNQPANQTPTHPSTSHCLWSVGSMSQCPVLLFCFYVLVIFFSFESQSKSHTNQR